MKALLRIGLLASVLMFAVVPPGQADVRILNISVSPRLLMEIYKAWDKGSTTIPMISSKIFSMLVQSTESESRPHFQFRFEVRDGNTMIAGVDFQTTSPINPGRNLFSANQITTRPGSTVTYNNDYINRDEVVKMLQGQDTQIQGKFRLVITPIDPQGPAYLIAYALFAPPSAQNNPPRIIYPNNIAVNTLLPMFSWSPGQNASTYEVLVSPNQDPTVNTYWRSEKTRVNQVLYAPSARTLENGKKYYWMVIAYDKFGNAIGGVNGKSEPAWFEVNSAAKVNTAVSPLDVDAALRIGIKQKEVFDALGKYRPVAVESTSPDLADLLRQIRDGSAHITAFDLE